MKMTRKFIVALLTVTLLMTVSCKKSNKIIVNSHDDAYGDVILKKMKMSGDIKYLPVFFAGGEGILEGESSVTTPDGTVYSLNEFWAGPGVLTAKGEVKNQFDFAGDYHFKLKFNDGYIKETEDILENVELPIPEISVIFDAAAQTITVNWTAVPGADLYCLKLTELDIANTQPLFKKAYLPVNITSYTIHIDGGEGWMRPLSDLHAGEEYWVAVAAKKVEIGAEISGISHDFQASSCNKTKIYYQN